MTGYKIRHIGTGLYSLGGCTPRWGKIGKFWTGPGKIRSHLNQIKIIPDTWEVIEFILFPGKAETAKEFYANKGKRSK